MEKEGYRLSMTSIALIAIIAIGLILRIIASFNLGVSADDMHYAPHAIDFISSGKLQTWDQAPLWYMFTDISYKMFGTTQFASRLAAILFGTLSILLIFLIAKKLFKKDPIALIASSIVAFSPFLIKNTMAEMDIMMMFFVMLSVFMFIKSVESKKKKFLYMGIISLGVACLTKHYALLFLPALYAYYLLSNKDVKMKSKIKDIVLISIVFVIVISPLLISNYLTYDSHGILDFQFTRLLKIGYNESSQYYSWVAGYDSGVDINGFFLGNSRNYEGSMPTLFAAFNYLLIADIIALIFGVLGMIMLFIKDKKNAWFIVGLFVVPLIIMGSTSIMGKHFVFESLLLSLPAGLFINELREKFKIRIRHVLIIVLLINLVMLGLPYEQTNSIYASGPENKLINYKESNIDKSSIVIVDSRIYRGRIAWIFNDRHYIESNSFLEVLANQDQIPGEKIPVKTYFIECVQDDCGWGNVFKQQEFNQSNEDLISAYSNGSALKKEISYKENKFNILGIGLKQYPRYRVYERNIMMNSGIVQIADSTHSLFLYPLGYKNKEAIFDSYNLDSAKNKILYGFGRFILWIDLLLVLIFVILSIKYTIKER